MKISKMAIAVAITGMLSSGNAFAQQPGLYQPASAQQTNYEYGSYYAQEPTPAEPEAGEAAAQEAPAAEPAADPGYAMASDGASCDSCGGGCDTGCSSCDTCCDDTPFKLFDGGECCPWLIGGWTAVGGTYNPDDPADRFNGPVTFNDRNEEIMLNQTYLFAERTLQNDGEGWGLGGRADVLYGSDYRFTTAAGLETDLATNTNKLSSDDQSFYGLAIPQAYLNVGYNDLSVKIGHFYTPIGYEVVTAPGNFFYSHAYTMQYGEPFTHTGALGSYALNDNWTMVGGVVRGWDNWEDNNDEVGYIGGATWTNCDKDLSIALTGITSEEDAAAELQRNMYSLVITRQLYDNLKYILQHDLGHQEGGSLTAGEDAEWYGINQYFLLDINDRWSAGMRAEWFRDDDGARVAGIGNIAGTKKRGWTGGGFEGNFYAVTAGLNYKPNGNLIVRPELRYDWYDGRDGNIGSPYDNGSDDDQFLMATDFILTY